MKYTNAYKDREGNRFIILNRNALCATEDNAIKQRVNDFVNYIPLGWLHDGIMEVDTDDSTFEIPHFACNGPYGIPIAVLSGPLFAKAESCVLAISSWGPWRPHITGPTTFLRQC